MLGGRVTVGNGMPTVHDAFGSQPVLAACCAGVAGLAEALHLRSWLQHDLLRHRAGSWHGHVFHNELLYKHDLPCATHLGVLCGLPSYTTHPSPLLLWLRQIAGN